MSRRVNVFASMTAVLSFVLLVVIYTPDLSSGYFDKYTTSDTVTHTTKISSTSVHQSTAITNATTTAITANPAAAVDKFGIEKIYPTKKGGREWYINMDNPKDDGIFSVGSGQKLIRQIDGSWRNTNPQVRMHVSTPAGSSFWKNVEITGYVKVISIDRHNKGIPIDIAWLARGDIHNHHIRCDGTALNGGIHNDGMVGWKKEIWFPGGYTDELAHAKVTDPIVGRWIGWKVVIYNTNNDSAVKMESYLDDKNNNHWIKVTDLKDDGSWYANSSDKKFYAANCGKPKDYIITKAGPITAFRSDNMIADFANLSVREIQSSS